MDKKEFIQKLLREANTQRVDMRWNRQPVFYPEPCVTEYPWSKGVTKEDIHKKTYITFYYKDRLITLYIVVLKEPVFDYEIKVGYTVKLSSDEEDIEFAEKVATGRAIKKPLYRKVLNDDIDYEMAKNKRHLQAIGYAVKEQIKKGKIVIKGIRD